MRQALCFAAVALLGCGSAFNTGPADGGAGDGSGAHDGPVMDGPPADAPVADGPAGSDGPVMLDGSRPEGGGGWSPVCPAHKPFENTMCSLPAGVDCEYPDLPAGIQYDLSCSTVFTCQDGMWNKIWPTGGGPGCRTDAAGNPMACLGPAAAIGPCPSTSLYCLYPSAQEACFCANLGGSTPQWSCAPTPTGCPFPRPRVGSKCMGSLDCVYDPCAYSETCNGTVWLLNDSLACATGG